MRLPWTRRDPDAPEALRDSEGNVAALVWLDSDGGVLVESTGSGVAVRLAKNADVHLGQMVDGEFACRSIATPELLPDKQPKGASQ